MIELNFWRWKLHHVRWKITLNKINDRLNIVEDRVVNMKTEQQKTTKTKHKGKRQINEQSIRELWGNFKWSNINGTGVLKGNMEKETWKNNGQNFLKFDKHYKPTDPRKQLNEPQAQETQKKTTEYRSTSKYYKIAQNQW